MYPDIFEFATFSLQIRLPSTRIRWIRQQTNLQLSESALQRGNFWIRYKSGIVWTLILNHTSPSPNRWGARGRETRRVRGGDVWHFRLVGAKSRYFLMSNVQPSSLPWIFKTVPSAILSLLYFLHFSFKSYNVCAVKPTIRDKSSWQTCLKRVLLSTISYIYYFILFKRRKFPPLPPNQCCL